MERLTPEQIRLLEELRELRDAGILTVDEFEVQVAKVLGRPLVVEPAPVDEELLAPAEVDGTVVANISGEAIHEVHTVNDDVALAPETSPESELLEYEFVELETSDENEILAEENQVVETLPNFDSQASAVVESETQQNKSSRRKVLIGTTAGLILVIAMVALGGGKSDSTSSQVIDSTTTVTENASTERTDAPTSLGNTQAPTTSSQSVAITTTVPQNASTGSAGRPTTATTPITTPLTTIANPTSVEPIVTALRLSKSHPVFYNYPWDLQQSVTFTALIDNDEQAANCNCGGGVRLLRKGPSGWSGANLVFSREQPGTWKVTLQDVEDGGTALVGLNEWCVAFTNDNGGKCSGPTVSFEVLETDRNPPTISDVTTSPTVVDAGDMVRVSARVVDATEVTNVFVNFEVEGNGVNYGVSCNGFSLTSGDRRDGIWSTVCTLPNNYSCETYPAFADIWATSPYADMGYFTYRLQVLGSC